MRSCSLRWSPINSRNFHLRVVISPSNGAHPGFHVGPVYCFSLVASLPRLQSASAPIKHIFQITQTRTCCYIEEFNM